MTIEITRRMVYGTQLNTYTFIGKDDAYLGALQEYDGDYLYTQPNGLERTLPPTPLRDAFHEIAKYWKENSIFA